MPNAGLFRFARETAHIFAPTTGSSVTASVQSLLSLPQAASLPLAPARARAAGANAWPLALPPVAASPYATRTPTVGKTVPRPYQVLTSSDTGEMEIQQPLLMDVTGMPSFHLYQHATSGNFVMSLQRKTQYMSDVQPGDLAGIRALGDAMYEMLKHMSQGPYKTPTLRAMGHPYGFDQKPGGEVVGRRIARSVRGVGSIGHVRGVRGSVPDRTVVNEQSGEFLRSWRWNYTLSADGAHLNFWNTAKTDPRSGNPISIGWLLSHGTTRMQPHGPFTYVAAVFVGQFNAEWTRVTQRAFARHQSRQLLMQAQELL